MKVCATTVYRLAEAEQKVNEGVRRGGKGYW